MSLHNINTVSGDGNVFGNRNIVNNIKIQRMPNEILVRDEADSFFEDYVPSNLYISNGHEVFAEGLENALRKFYSVEYKMIFLDQLKNTLRLYIDDYIAKKGDSSNNLTLKKMMFFLEQEISVLPKIVTKNDSTQNIHKTEVFISYCRKDKSFLDDLKRHLAPLKNTIEFWDDSRVKPGQKWEKEIDQAMSKAKVAILLVSADYFNSEFITTNEIPILIERACEQGTTIISVFLRHCLYEEYPQIMQYQGLNDPKYPIASLDENARECMWVELARQVKSIVNTPK